MDPAMLARWTLLAHQDGNPRGTALCDNEAASQEELMFLKGDVVLVLACIDEHKGCYLGFCEGVIGRFNRTHFHFEPPAVLSTVHADWTGKPTAPPISLPLTGGSLYSERDQEALEGLISPSLPSPDAPSEASSTTSLAYALPSPSVPLFDAPSSSNASPPTPSFACNAADPQTSRRSRSEAEAGAFGFVPEIFEPESRSTLAVEERSTAFSSSSSSSAGRRGVSLSPAPGSLAPTSHSTSSATSPTSSTFFSGDDLDNALGRAKFRHRRLRALDGEVNGAHGLRTEGSSFEFDRDDEEVEGEELPEGAMAEEREEPELGELTMMGVQSDLLSVASSGSSFGVSGFPLPPPLESQGDRASSSDNGRTVSGAENGLPTPPASAGHPAHSSSATGTSMRRDDTSPTPVTTISSTEGPTNWDASGSLPSLPPTPPLNALLRRPSGIPHSQSASSFASLALSSRTEEGYDEDGWDIFADYARASMYAPPSPPGMGEGEPGQRRASMAAQRRPSWLNMATLSGVLDVDPPIAPPPPPPPPPPHASLSSPVAEPSTPVVSAAAALHSPKEGEEDLDTPTIPLSPGMARQEPFQNSGLKRSQSRNLASNLHDQLRRERAAAMEAASSRATVTASADASPPSPSLATSPTANIAPALPERATTKASPSSPAGACAEAPTTAPLVSLTTSLPVDATPPARLAGLPLESPAYQAKAPIPLIIDTTLAKSGPATPKLVTSPKVDSGLPLAPTAVGISPKPHHSAPALSGSGASSIAAATTNFQGSTGVANLRSASGPIPVSFFLSGEQAGGVQTTSYGPHSSRAASSSRQYQPPSPMLGIGLGFGLNPSSPKMEGPYPPFERPSGSFCGHPAAWSGPSFPAMSNGGSSGIPSPSLAQPRPGFFPQPRPRSRSFSGQSLELSYPVMRDGRSQVVLLHGNMGSRTLPAPLASTFSAPPGAHDYRPSLTSAFKVGQQPPPLQQQQQPRGSMDSFVQPGSEQSSLHSRLPPLQIHSPLSTPSSPTVPSQLPQSMATRSISSPLASIPPAPPNLPFASRPGASSSAPSSPVSPHHPFHSSRAPPSCQSPLPSSPSTFSLLPPVIREPPPSVPPQQPETKKSEGGFFKKLRARSASFGGARTPAAVPSPIPAAPSKPSYAVPQSTSKPKATARMPHSGRPTSSSSASTTLSRSTSRHPLSSPTAPEAPPRGLPPPSTPTNWPHPQPSWIQELPLPATAAGPGSPFGLIRRTSTSDSHRTGGSTMTSTTTTTASVDDLSLSSSHPSESSSSLATPGVAASPSSLSLASGTPKAASPMLRSQRSQAKLKKGTSTGGGGQLSPVPLPLPAPVSSRDFQDETVNEGGLEFELLKPLARKASLDSRKSSRAFLNRNGSSESRRMTDSGRTNASPADSMLDGEPVLDEKTIALRGKRARELEQKWLSIIAIERVAAVRKDKRVRKLLREDLPASLRGRIWTFLLDASARRLPELYDQLVLISSVSSEGRMQEDIAKAFSEHLEAQEPNTGRQDLTSVLTAYLAFNSTVRYRPEMLSIVCTLLLHSPAEDAFWLIASVFDMGLRSYYAPDQLAIEAIVLVQLLEAVDKPLAIRLVVELQLDMEALLSRWVLPMFIGVLPWQTALKIWDIAFLEGGSFLLRTALAILLASRHRLMDSATLQTKERVKQYLYAIPQDELLSTESLLPVIDRVKGANKEDDLRNLRAKAAQQLQQATADKRATRR